MSPSWRMEVTGSCSTLGRWWGAEEVGVAATVLLVLCFAIVLCLSFSGACWLEGREREGRILHSSFRESEFGGSKDERGKVEVDRISTESKSLSLRPFEGERERNKKDYGSLTA